MERFYHLLEIRPMTITGICSFNLTLVGVNIYFNEFLVINEKERRVKGMLEEAWNYLLGRDKRCVFNSFWFPFCYSMLCVLHIVESQCH